MIYKKIEVKESNSLSESLGISKERIVVLNPAIASILSNPKTRGRPSTLIAGIVNGIEYKDSTELAYCIFQATSMYCEVEKAHEIGHLMADMSGHGTEEAHTMASEYLQAHMQGQVATFPVSKHIDN